MENTSLDQPIVKKKKKKKRSEASEMECEPPPLQAEATTPKYFVETQPQAREERRPAPARFKLYMNKGQTAKALKVLTPEDIDTDMGPPCHLSPLMTLISHPHGIDDKMLRILTEKGQDVNKCTRCIFHDQTVDITPLMYVIHLYFYVKEKGNLEKPMRDSMSALLKAGANVNLLSQYPVPREIRKPDDNTLSATPLAFAISNYSNALIPELLQYGADANIPTSQGYAPIHIICKYLDPDAMEMLFTHHPLPEKINTNQILETDEDKESSLHLLAFSLILNIEKSQHDPAKVDSCISYAERIINTLKLYGIDFSAKTEDGSTADKLVQELLDDLPELTSTRQKEKILKLFRN
ncbi:hypothetical protein GCM10023116_21560 [Kistimonas scapharcae]|uniref:Uncharacterized protein n=1 Tax=Kistimonas scapharcae TaxID=1036133 RepID=A0ABP8V1B6_9GAMM